MELSSYLFLFVFFPITYFIYFFVPKKYKKIYLLLVSIIFVSSFSIKHTIILLLISILTYYTATEKNKARLIFGIILNVLSLIIYKYIDFIFVNLNGFFHINIPILKLIVPIGLSFFTFQNIAFLVDVYKGVKKGDLLNYLLYTFYFPKFINGPILRINEFIKNINLTNPSLDNIYAGIKRFCFGLGKVLILSSILGNIWNNMYSMAFLGGISISMAWFGILCYSLYLYFNFSGFIDISLGISLMFNITLPENFNYPYLSTSFTDFWRRWHMSLSTWFRDYIYIPLGGNRKGNVYINILIVFLVTGIWHGSSWNFILWGLYHGLLNILDKIIRKKDFYKKIPKSLSIVIVDLMVMLGWVMFASNGINASLTYYKYMFGLKNIVSLQYNFNYFLNFYNVFFIVLSILVSINIYNFIKKRLHKNVCEIFDGIVAIIILIISMMFLVNNSYVPSIYANF